MRRSTLMLPTVPLSMLLSIVLLAGCAARQPRCDSQLRPINLAPTAAAPAAARHRPMTHE